MLAHQAQTDILDSAATVALVQLYKETSQHRLNNLSYAGEITPAHTYRFLTQHGGVLVDVRTQPEWQFVGQPDIAATKGQLVSLSWRTYPSFAPNEQFASNLCAISKDTPLFFICRSGGRSLDAAVAMTAQGYDYCFNVMGGFEGDPDASGHRGVRDGWKATNLPWKQA